MVDTQRPLPASGERGFSLIELMIVAFLSTIVVGSAVMMASQVQQGYSHQLDDAGVQQETRFVVEWIAKTLATAGSNPYRIVTSNCPATGTAFQALRFDPDGDGIQDDVRVQADINPPNGLLLGLSGLCNEPGEDVTIAHDPQLNAITRRDRATDASPVAVTSGVFSQLVFSYLAADRTATTVPAAAAYVRVSLTGRSEAFDQNTGDQGSFTYSSEVRLRSR
jgi:prepilin-type N-terminal cleavage/methylation domain-containing protein